MNQAEHMSAHDDLATSVWWIHPAIAFGGPALLVALAAYQISPETYSFYWKTRKFFDVESLVTAISCIMVFGFGTLLGQARRREDHNDSLACWQERIPWQHVRLVFNLSFVLCLVGYISWAGVAVKNGLSMSLVLDAFTGKSGAAYTLREQYLTTVAGVTTMTQFGIATIVLAPPLGVAQGWKKVQWQIGAVLFLALVRAVLHSERLALIELVVPLMLSCLLLRRVSRRHRVAQQNLVRLAPILGGVLLFFVFSAFEYSRSWLGFYAAHESSFWKFSALRLLGYYSTALNNGALLYGSLAEPLNAPYFTFAFAWKFPLVKELVYSLFPAVPFNEASYMNLLGSQANPEFNNPGGLFLPLADFGAAGGLLYWALCGMACGYLYRQFLKRSAAGLFLYPVVFTSLIEASRILYWADGRFFPPMFVLVVSVLFLFREPLSRHVNAVVSSTQITMTSETSMSS